MSTVFKDFLQKRGIQHVVGPPNTPQYFSIVERANRTIGEMAEAMRKFAMMADSSWGYARKYAAYVRNRCPTKSNPGNITPFQVQTGTVPDLSNIKIFGAPCMVKEAGRKLADKAFPGRFVGFDETRRGYLVIPDGARKPILSRDVVFNELKAAEIALNQGKILASEAWEYITRQDLELALSKDSMIEDERIVDIQNEHSTSQLPTQPTRRSPRLAALYSGPECILVDTFTHGTIEECYSGDVSPFQVPSTITEARAMLEAPHWEEAIQTEVESVAINDTLSDPMVLPEGKRATKLKFLFALKFDQNGEIDRYKARLVFQHVKRISNVDWEEIFAPVVDKVTVRLFFSRAAALQMKLFQMDVTTAFLYGDTLQEIYVVLPDELRTQEEIENNLVRQLLKSLYGTPDAPRIWYTVLSTKLLELGLQQSEVDPCLFFSIEMDIWIMVYVDDLILATKTIEAQARVIAFLEQCFRMKRIGSPSMFLGMNIDHCVKNKSILLSQRTYIQKVVSDFQHSVDQVTSYTPMKPSIHLEKIKETQVLTTKPYRQVIGCLVYLTVCTRPDIAFAVSVLSKFLSAPTEDHWKAAMRVVAYLRDTSNYGLSLGGEGPYTLTAYVDSDWANDPEEMKSITGFLVYLGNSLISWTSKKQKLVTLSSTEAEFIALCDVTRELLWLQPFVEEYRISNVKEDTLIYEDNIPAINLANNEQTKGRTKHLSIKMKFIYQNVKLGNIYLKHISSPTNAADSLTKSLSRVPFQKHRKQMVIPQSLLSELRGSVRNHFQSAQTNQDGCQISGSLESNRTNSEQYIRGRHTTPNISENNFANNSEEDDM